MLISIEFKSELMTYFDPALLRVKREQLLQLLKEKEEGFYQFCMSWLVPSYADHILAATPDSSGGTRHPLAELLQLLTLGKCLHLVVNANCRGRRGLHHSKGKIRFRKEKTLD